MVYYVENTKGSTGEFNSLRLLLLYKQKILSRRKFGRELYGLEIGDGTANFKSQPSPG